MRRYRPLKNWRGKLRTINENDFRFPVLVVPDRMWQVFGRNIVRPRRNIRVVNWDNNSNNNKNRKSKK